MNGENQHGKNSTRWFSGHHSRNSTTIKTSGYKYLIPTYNWILTLIPNWTCSVVTISLFDARLPSTWLTNARIPVRDFNLQLEKVIGCKVLQFIQTIKIKKMLGYKTLQYTNTALSSQERWTGANSVFVHNLHDQTLLNTCATCVTFDDP